MSMHDSNVENSQSHTAVFQKVKSTNHQGGAIELFVSDWTFDINELQLSKDKIASVGRKK